MRIVSLPTPAALATAPPAGLALLGALALALALLAGGCGSHLVKVDSSVLRLRIDEYSITPQDVEVRAGRLKIVAVNTGILTHNVRVEPADDPHPIGGTGVAQPGQVVIAKVELKPGRYRLVDTIANHADLGDYATMTVR
jgi:hypothetical protein